VKKKFNLLLLKVFIMAIFWIIHTRIKTWFSNFEKILNSWVSFHGLNAFKASPSSFYRGDEKIFSLRKHNRCTLPWDKHDFMKLWARSSRLEGYHKLFANPQSLLFKFLYFILKSRFWSLKTNNILFVQKFHIMDFECALKKNSLFRKTI
jgi:hypothetical protein